MVANNAAGGIGVQFEKVRRVFDHQVVAVDGTDLTVEPGEFVALLGPSGCGKSTLLRLASGLDEPSEGRVRLGDSTATALSQQGRIAFVFQDPHLMPWRNLLRNVALPLELRGVAKAERLNAAQQAIEQVGLADAATRYPAQLSGGMRMRASLARAMVTQPWLLLMDEPFAAVDEMTRHHLDEQLRRLWLDRGMTVLFVTHSVEEAVYLADRVVVFSKRPARIVGEQRIGLPRDRPASSRTDHRFADAERAVYELLEKAQAGA